MDKTSNLSETGKYLGNTIWNRGFIAMCVTQFTVAMNDNMFKWLIIPIGKAYAHDDLIRTLGSVFLVIPFLMWTSIAGYITDKHSKRNVMIWCKFAEIVLLLFAVFVFCMGPVADPEVPKRSFMEILTNPASIPAKVPLLLFILFLLGSQSTFFSPSKYGSIPELVPDEKLSEANGVIAMTTMIACVLGQILGGYIYAWTSLTGMFNGKSEAIGIPGADHNWWIGAVLLVGTAVVGYVASFFIPKLKAVAPDAKFPRNPLLQTGRDLAMLYSHRKLFWVAVASAFFWGLAILAGTNIDKFGRDLLNLDQEYVSILAAILSVGIGVGAVLCGIWSRGRIEMGLVPVGAFGIGIFLLLLGLNPSGTGSPLTFSFFYAAVMLFLVGTTAGLYDIPLAAYIQHNAPEETRGRLLAAYNFLSFSAMLVFTLLFFVFSFLFDAINGLGISFLAYPPSLSIWIATGLMVLAVFLILAYVYFVELMNIVFTFFYWLFYHPKVIGLENIPKDSGALFVCNHVSLLDGPLVYVASRCPIRFFAHKDFIPPGPLDHLATRTGLIRVLPGKKVILALKEARAGLKNGDYVGIFPEGGITRTGQFRGFENGFLSILKGDENVPIIPVYIGGLFGSMFSYKYSDEKTDGQKEGRFLYFKFGGSIKLWPRKLPHRPIVAFGKPIFQPKNAMEVQRAVEELGVDAMKQNGKELPFPPVKLLENCRKVGNRDFLLDSTGMKMSGRKLLASILVLRRLLRREVLKPDEKNVGLFVPMSVGGSLSNAALSVDSRVAVNLNFTFSEEILNHCIEKAEIKTVLTSRKMVERFPDLKFNAEVVCVEDLLKKITFADKFFAALGTYVLPMGILKRVLGLNNLKSDDPLAIIFTSGSTGDPKGVVLSQRNIAEEARAFVDMVGVSPKDTLLGFLPFFHAFGYAGNFWLTVLSGAKGVFHFNPLDAKKVGELARKYKCTFIPSTPTFLRNYLRRCPKEDFENVPTVLCGAEKLPLDLIDAWEQKYGVRPSEGFGTTELSPCSSVNLPDCRIRDSFNKYRKDGSIGRALPNVALKIVDLETGEDLPPDEIGMMVAKGPIVMQGYYKEPELTAEVLSPDGWYKTGDVGKVDADGFFWITGRQSRISKIGGEMVPHVLIEEEILKILNEAGDVSEGVPIAVAAVPDEKKGERIVVFHEKLSVPVETIRAKLMERDLPNLWIPAANSFYEVEKIPLLGTGKLDLAAVKKMAQQIG